MVEQMDKEFIKELNIFCSDHYETFGCYPMEFEYNDEVYLWDEFVYSIENYKKPPKKEK